MRKLMWFAVGFAGACAAGVYLVSGRWLLLLAVFSLLSAVPLLFLKTKRGRILGVALLGCAVSFCWVWIYQSEYLDALRQYDGMEVDIQVQISDYSYDTDYGVAADGKWTLENKTYRIRLYLPGEDALSPGDSVRGTVRLRLTTEDGIQGATYHQGNGIFLLGYVREGAEIRRTQTVPGKYFAAQLRNKILDTLDQVFPEDTQAFARALLLGDSSKLSYEENTAFQISGIRHVIAVSGLHVSILFSVVYLLAFRQRALTTLLGIPVLLVFAALAGFTPSIVRACIMQSIMILALLMEKEYDPPTALATAVLVMLLANPMTVTSVSFQLSVGCMVGIFLFSEKIQKYLFRGRLGKWSEGRSFRARCIRWIVGSISVSIGSMIITTPLCAWYFGTVSLVGIVTNLLTLWIVFFIFYGIMLASLLGGFWVPLGKWVAWIVSWPMRYVLLVAKFLARLPNAAVYTCSIYIVVWLVLCYGLLTVFLYCRKRRPVLLISIISVSLVIALGLSYLEPRLDSYRVSVLDVGQGQCILIQSGEECYLVDCGGEYPQGVADSAAELLLSQGITCLDGLFVTHYDKDHVAGVLPFLSRIQVKNVYLPDIFDDGQYRTLLSQACPRTMRWVSEDTVLKNENFTISLFTADPQAQGNESCLSILFQRENCDILITGDRSTEGEKALLEKTTLPQLEILIAGHHGSGSSTSFELLEATHPQMVAISVGQDNMYGHPSQEMLDRLELFDAQVWRTDLHGTIRFRG